MNYLLAVALIACACSDKTKSEPEAEPAHDPQPGPNSSPAPDPVPTVNGFFTGTPTLIVGTAGDDRADQRIAVQAGLFRGLAFPAAKLVPDSSITGDWPERPVLYGGEDTNSLLASLGASLPLRADSNRIEVDGQRFDQPGFRIVAVVPASDRHPAFVVYAGTGEAGMAEINAGMDLGAPIVIADAHGTLVHGRYEQLDGRWVARLGERNRRIGYRKQAREHGTYLFPEMVPETDQDAARIDACEKALTDVAAKLEIAVPEPVDVYLYPDPRSKQQLTGNGGHGHAVPSGRALHMLAVDPDALSSLMAHEATHVLAYFGWGPAGTPVMGEGLAVWVSGQYGGKPLAKLYKSAEALPLESLLGQGWLKLPEQDKYPLAAAVVEALIERVGLEKVREHLYSATPDQFDDALTAAGITRSELEQAVKAKLR